MADDDLLGYVPTDDEIEDDEEVSSKTYFLDLENGRIGRNIDGLEAVKQAIMKAILTPRFKSLIYSDDYGSEVQNEKDIAPSSTYLSAVIPEVIKDCLIPDDRILDVGDFSIEQQGDTLTVDFSVSTIFGDIEIEEVI